MVALFETLRQKCFTFVEIVKVFIWDGCMSKLSNCGTFSKISCLIFKKNIYEYWVFVGQISSRISAFHMYKPCRITEGGGC